MEFSGTLPDDPINQSRANPSSAKFVNKTYILGEEPGPLCRQLDKKTTFMGFVGLELLVRYVQSRYQGFSVRSLALVTTVTQENVTH